MANLIGVVAVVAWLLFDARFEASVDWWRFQQASLTGQDSIGDMGDWWWLGIRNKVVLLLLVLAASSAVAMLAGLCWGDRRQRSVRAWMASTTMIALWLAVALNWQEIAWLGKQIRLREVLNEYKAVVVDLQNQWPLRDGERERIGPFMAYPPGQPGTLILLKLPEFNATSTTFSVIEGNRAGVLRFELVGAERGDWLEWHPVQSTPGDFRSGLAEEYQLERYQKLSEHWYLVRYGD